MQVAVVSEDLLSKLEKHTYTVYIIANVQNMQELKEVIEVGNGVLDAGACFKNRNSRCSVF